MAAQPPYALEVSPDSTLQFIITAAPTNEGEEGSASRCVMTLTHRGHTNQHLVFKVKTTQPRRYLVRPNQGIVAPGTSETVSILLVDKDRQVLWDTYSRLGQSALDNSKDKFLVQSCEASNDFAAQFNNQPRLEGNQYRAELVEALTARWNSIATGQHSVFNKKLHIRHMAAAGGAGAALPAALRAADRGDPESMDPDQLREEAEVLRRKYDELVAFSVNLTAERDILNNTLEQTKRDLNRELASRTALEKQGRKGAGASDGKAQGAGGGVAFAVLLAAIAVAFLVGIKTTNEGAVGALGRVPVVGGLLGFGGEFSESADRDRLREAEAGGDL